MARHRLDNALPVTASAWFGRWAGSGSSSADEVGADVPEPGCDGRVVRACAGLFGSPAGEVGAGYALDVGRGCEVDRGERTARRAPQERPDQGRDDPPSGELVLSPEASAHHPGVQCVG